MKRTPHLGIPMRELEQQTGFPRATILFYIKEGLLPQPMKSAKNMSTYDRRFIDGLQLIRELRDKHGLSLAQIKEVIQRKTGGIGVELLLDVRDRMFDQISRNANDAHLTFDELCQQTRLSAESVTIFTAASLLFQDESGAYHTDSVATGRVLSQLLSMNFPMSALMTSASQLAQLAEAEVKAFTENISTPMLSIGENADAIGETLRNGFDLLTSMVSLAHIHALRKALQNTDWGKQIATQANQPPQSDK